MRGTPSMSHLMSAQLENYTSSLTNRRLVSFWSEHAALRPPKCVLREFSQEHLGKTQKTSSQDRKTDTDSQTGARTEAPKGCHTDERKGKHGATRPPHKQNTSTHKHQHAHPTHTPRQVEPGQEPLRGENPKKNNDVNKGETADSRSRRKLAESCMPRSVADRKVSTFRRGRNQAGHGSSRTTSGSCRGQGGRAARQRPQVDSLGDGRLARFSRNRQRRMRTRPSRTSLPHLANPHMRRADRLRRTLTYFLGTTRPAEVWSM